MPAATGRIIKNTGFLYFRMIIVMIITLYTSRVVLERLGVNDYGIYTVVGGIVTIFSILSSSMSSAISRFLTYELAHDDDNRIRTVFSTSIIIQCALALIVLVLVESGGVWFLNNKMNINPSRLTAANWVLQCSAITFLVNMISVPYNAAIIAHEKMQAFAYISILEVVLKLGVAFSLYIKIFDSLIMYAVLTVIAAIIVRFSYSLYCERHFKECRLEICFDKDVMKGMMAFSGWNFIGSSSAILRDQGVNVVINLFCGTAVNTARGISMQVYQAVTVFSQNFMVAVNPQIIKSYANSEHNYMFDLAFRASRLSFCLLYCISLPLILEMSWVLSLWLTIVPPFTSGFSSLILIFGMIEALSLPLMYINQATGKIKVYQLTVGGIQMLNFPISYILLRAGYSPYSVYLLSIALSLCCLGARLIILKRQVGLSIATFCRDVLSRTVLVALTGAILPLAYFLYVGTASIESKIALIAISIISTAGTSFMIGCRKTEREYLLDKLRLLISKYSHHA